MQIRKLISRSNISTPRSNAELKDMGFTKLVKRDSGVYENVTARDGDSRYVVRDKPETLPNLSKHTIRDHDHRCRARSKDCRMRAQ